jgi:hypothetical protein
MKLILFGPEYLHIGYYVHYDVMDRIREPIRRLIGEEIIPLLGLHVNI